jgi:hypothetical protein
MGLLAAAPEAGIAEGAAGREAVSSETTYQRVGGARRSRTVRYRTPTQPKPVREQLITEAYSHNANGET